MSPCNNGAINPAYISVVLMSTQILLGWCKSSRGRAFAHNISRGGWLRCTFYFWNRRIWWGIFVTSEVMVAISSMQSLAQDKGICVIKFSPMRAKLYFSGWKYLCNRIAGKAGWEIKFGSQYQQSQVRVHMQLIWGMARSNIVIR